MAQVRITEVKNPLPSSKHVGSIFPALSLDRDVTHWEDYLATRTPVQQIGELYFKREDFWSPLGAGSVNGSKARQCLWLVNKMYQKGCEGIVTGASLLSPQHAIVAAMAKHFDIPTIHVVGATTPESSSKHPSVAIAKILGAKFDYIGSAYNSSLQPRVNALMNEARQHGHYWDKIEYGITLDHRKPEYNTPGNITAFHKVGAQQVANLSEEMETLIIPAGSCNTFVSIMYGLAACNLVGRGMHPNLKKIIAVGIGPSRLNWAEERLYLISKVVNFDAGMFMSLAGFEYIDLHGTGVYKYSDKVDFEYEGIKLHYTYEAKTMAFLAKNRPRDLFNRTTVFWIVGGIPFLEATKRAIGVV